MDSGDIKANTKPRILVVDDEPVILDILQEFLRYEGFEVLAAGSGEDAVTLLAKEPFDIVLTDMKMPGMGGLALLQHVADLERDTITVMMTGFGTVETAIEAMKRGAFDYVLKPFKPEDVVSVLRRGLDKLQLTRENFALRENVGFYELSEALSSAMPLEEQLDMIAALVRDNFNADGVCIMVEERHEKGVYVRRAGHGVQTFAPKVEALLARMQSGDAVNVTGEAAVPWLEHSADAHSRVACLMATPLRMRGQPFGVLTALCTKPGQRFTEGQRKGLTIFGGRAANAIETARVHGDLKETFTQTIEGFARALEAKDAYTHGHSDRVAMYSALIGEAMGLPTLQVDKLHHGGMMHDIGKIGIRTGDLNKPQRLTPEEYAMFKTHPVVGRRILEPIRFLVHLVPCVYHHHESWNGKGYPEGLSEEGIPLEARILAVADSYDAMTSNRSYRKAMPHTVTLGELKRGSGKQYDPQVVVAFLGAIETFRAKRIAMGLPVPL